MKKIILAFLLAGCLTASAAAKAPLKKVEVAFFTSPFCGFCQRCAREYLPEFKEKYKDVINFTEYNVFEKGNNTLFYDTIKAYGLEMSGVPAMIIGDSFLVGYPQDIRTQAPMAIEKALANGEKTRVQKPAPFPTSAAPSASEKMVQASPAKKLPGPLTKNASSKTSAPTAKAAGAAAAEALVVPLAGAPAPSTSLPAEDGDQAKDPTADAYGHPTQTTTQSMFEQITFWAIIGAGLVDGINPCAFAVIVFFISFLSVYKYDKREIIIVSLSYCAAVFIAYILIGLGLFNFLYALSSFYYVILIFKYLTIGLCALFFFLSLYDFIIYKKTGNTDKILLQLPKSYKEYIHKVMRFFLRDKEKSTLRLVGAALAVGFVVSLVEAVCTGQVYLPTIVILLKEADAHFLRAMQYLLLYNFMFIVPLIVVFVLVLMGYESQGFNAFLKKHLAFTKFLLCLVFLGLLILLIFSM